MSMPLTCLICDRPHGAGQQPWTYVPPWVRVCDECMPADLTGLERTLLGLVRMPFGSDGARMAASYGNVAESTARRWLPVLVEHGLARGPLVHGWWSATHEGIEDALELVFAKRDVTGVSQLTLR